MTIIPVKPLLLWFHRHRKLDAMNRRVRRKAEVMRSNWDVASKVVATQGTKIRTLTKEKSKATARAKQLEKKLSESSATVAERDHQNSCLWDSLKRERRTIDCFRWASTSLVILFSQYENRKLLPSQPDQKLPNGDDPVVKALNSNRGKLCEAIKRLSIHLQATPWGKSSKELMRDILLCQDAYLHGTEEEALAMEPQARAALVGILGVLCESVQLQRETQS